MLQVMHKKRVHDVILPSAEGATRTHGFMLPDTNR